MLRGIPSMLEVNGVNRGRGELRERYRQSVRTSREMRGREICKLYAELRLLFRLSEV